MIAVSFNLSFPFSRGEQPKFTRIRYQASNAAHLNETMWVSRYSLHHHHHHHGMLHTQLQQQPHCTDQSSIYTNGFTKRKTCMDPYDTIVVEKTEWMTARWTGSSDPGRAGRYMESQSWFVWRTGHRRTR